MDKYTIAWFSEIDGKTWCIRNLSAVDSIDVFHILCKDGNNTTVERVKEA